MTNSARANSRWLSIICTMPPMRKPMSSASSPAPPASRGAPNGRLARTRPKAQAARTIAMAMIAIAYGPVTPQFLHQFDDPPTQCVRIPYEKASRARGTPPARRIPTRWGRVTELDRRIDRPACDRAGRPGTDHGFAGLHADAWRAGQPPGQLQRRPQGIGGVVPADRGHTEHRQVIPLSQPTVEQPRRWLRHAANLTMLAAPPDTRATWRHYHAGIRSQMA